MDEFFGMKMPKLGFGLMRLPEKDGAIDVEQMKTMVDLFMSAGMKGTSKNPLLKVIK